MCGPDNKYGKLESFERINIFEKFVWDKVKGEEVLVGYCICGLVAQWGQEQVGKCFLWDESILAGG